MYLLYLPSFVNSHLLHHSRNRLAMLSSPLGQQRERRIELRPIFGLTAERYRRQDYLLQVGEIVSHAAEPLEAHEHLESFGQLASLVAEGKEGSDGQG